MITYDPVDHPAGKNQGMLSSLVVPRPIAMISTASVAGVVNVAPYSYYMPVTGDPPLVAVTMGARRSGDGAPKHTWENATRTGDFVVNVTTEAMADHIEVAAMEFPAEVSEGTVCGWTTVPSQRVSAPSLAESSAHLECRIHRVVDLGEGEAAVHLVLAEVVCITLDESVCTQDFRVDTQALAAVGRMPFPYFTHTGPGLFGLERITYAEHAATGRLPGRLG